MLHINKQRKKMSYSRVFTMIAVLIVAAGGYLLSLVVAPSVAPIVSMKPINVNELPAPMPAEKRIVIPKIGVNIDYAPGSESLDHGAEWRFPERGNPDTGGHFIIAAHRFILAPTHIETIRKSPFYNIDKLVLGDKIVVDYKGTRYGYEISKITNAQPDQTEIETASDEPKLTLYSHEQGDDEAGRVVITAQPLGKVALTNSKN